MIGSMSAVHDWRGFPLMSIEQEPQTSSKHPCSQAMGSISPQVYSPDAFGFPSKLK